MTSEQRRKLVALIPWQTAMPHFYPHNTRDKDRFFFPGEGHPHLVLTSGIVVGTEETERQADSKLMTLFEESLEKMLALREKIREAEPQSDYMTSQEYFEYLKKYP